MRDTQEVGSTDNMPVEIAPAFAWESPRLQAGECGRKQGSMYDRGPVLATTPGQVGENQENQPVAWPPEEGVREVGI